MGEIVENNEGPKHPGNSCFLFCFQWVLESGRHHAGFPDPVGSILVEYEPEPSYMDLIETRLSDSCPNPGIVQPVYLLYRDHISAV